MNRHVHGDLFADEATDISVLMLTTLLGHVAHVLLHLWGAHLGLDWLTSYARCYMRILQVPNWLGMSFGAQEAHFELRIWAELFHVCENITCLEFICHNSPQRGQLYQLCCSDTCSTCRTYPQHSENGETICAGLQQSLQIVRQNHQHIISTIEARGTLSFSEILGLCPLTT